MITCIVLLYLVSRALGHRASSNESIDREHQDIEYLFQSDNDNHTHRNEYAGSEVNNYIVTDASSDKEDDQSLASIQTINMDNAINVNNRLIESPGCYPLVSNSQNYDSVMVNMCFPNDYYHHPSSSSSSSSSFLDFNFYQSNLPMSPMPLTSEASSSSSWYRIHNHTHFFFSPYNHNRSSSSTTKSRSTAQYSNTSITMNQRYLILKNTIKSAIEPFLKWMKQNSIQLFKQTILFLKASEVYLCTLLSDVKCVLLHQSQRFDDFLDTLHDSCDDSDYFYFNYYHQHGDSDQNTSTDGGYYYSSMTNWLSPDDILFRASISLRQNHTASTLSSSSSSSSSSSYSRYHHNHHRDSNQQHIADSSSSPSSSSTHRVLPDLSSKLNNKNLKVKGTVKSKGYSSSPSSSSSSHVENDISTTGDDDEHQWHNYSNTSATTNSTNHSHSHDSSKTNQKNDTKYASNNTNFHYIQSLINYWINGIIQLFTFLYTGFILPGLQHKFFKPVLFVWNSLGIQFFPTTSSSGSESQLNENGGDIIFTSLGPSLLICFMIVAFVTSILQFGSSVSSDSSEGVVDADCDGRSGSRRGSDKLSRKRIGTVGGTSGDDTTTFNYTGSTTNVVNVIPDTTTAPLTMNTTATARNRSSASTVMFQRIVFFIKVCVLLTVVLTLYSYLVTVENISRHRLVQRTRVKAVNQYILKPTPSSSVGSTSNTFDKYNPFISHPSNIVQEDNICTSSDDAKLPSHITNNNNNSNKRTETLNLQWINTAIESFWLVGSDGGLGPYLSETIETILNTELSAVPPNILAQVRVNRFSFGVDPPVVRAVSSQYEIRNKRHCQSLKHHKHYAHSSKSSSASQQQSELQSFFKQKPKATSPSSVSTDPQQQFSTDDSTKSSSTKAEQQQQPQPEPNNFYWRSNAAQNTAEQNTTSSTTTDSDNNSTTTTADSSDTSSSSFSSSSAAPLYDIINTVRSKLFSLNQHIDTSFPFPHYRYDQPRSYSSNKRKQKQQQQQQKKASYQYKHVRSDEIIRGCQVLTADIDIGYVSKDLDIVLALRSTSDVQTLYPEINVALTELLFAGKLRMEFELIPEYPFVGNTTFSFLEVPSLDMTISGFGSVDLSSLPGVYNLVNATVHWLLLQYTQPNAGHIDLKPYICPKCVDILVPPTFSTRFRESFSVLSNRTSILTHEVQTKSVMFSKNIQSVLKIKRKELVKGMKSFQKFLMDTKHAIERDYEPSFLLADTE